jgi:hypothetical protein
MGLLWFYREYFSLAAEIYPFNAGIKSIRATLPDKIFTGDFDS